MKASWMGLAALVALCSLGCGLADYEERMLATQQRAAQVEADQQRQDRMRANLDEPLQLPKPLDLFFRPPRGIRATPETFVHRGIIYQFPRQNTMTGLVTHVFVAVGADARTFPAVVLGHFGSDAERAVRKVHEVQRPGLEPLIFDSAEWEGSGDDQRGSYSGHLLRGPTPVAIIFRVDKGRLGEAAPILELSLQTLVIGSAVDEARKTYERQHNER